MLTEHVTAPRCRANQEMRSRHGEYSTSAGTRCQRTPCQHASTLRDDSVRSAHCMARRQKKEKRVQLGQQSKCSLHTAVAKEAANFACCNHWRHPLLGVPPSTRPPATPNHFLKPTLVLARQRLGIEAQRGAEARHEAEATRLALGSFANASCIKGREPEERSGRNVLVLPRRAAVQHSQQVLFSRARARAHVCAHTRDRATNMDTRTFRRK